MCCIRGWNPICGTLIWALRSFSQGLVEMLLDPTSSQGTGKVRDAYPLRWLSAYSWVVCTGKNKSISELTLQLLAYCGEGRIAPLRCVSRMLRRLRGTSSPEDRDTQCSRSKQVKVIQRRLMVGIRCLLLPVELARESKCGNHKVALVNLLTRNGLFLYILEALRLWRD